MPETMLLRRLLLPELKLTGSWKRRGTRTLVVEAEKVASMEVCPGVRRHRQASMTTGR